MVGRSGFGGLQGLGCRPGLGRRVELPFRSRRLAGSVAGDWRSQLVTSAHGAAAAAPPPSLLLLLLLLLLPLLAVRTVGGLLHEVSHVFHDCMSTCRARHGLGSSKQKGRELLL